MQSLSNPQKDQNTNLSFCIRPTKCCLVYWLIFVFLQCYLAPQPSDFYCLTALTRGPVCSAHLRLCSLVFLVFCTKDPKHFSFYCHEKSRDTTTILWRSVGQMIRAVQSGWRFSYLETLQLKFLLFCIFSTLGCSYNDIHWVVTDTHCLLGWR